MAKNSQQINEEKTAAASYIINFYQAVQNITHYYSQFLNFQVELKEKSKDANEIEEQDRQALITTMQNIRYYLHQTYTQYTAITEATENQTNKQITEAYQTLAQNFEYKITSLDFYVKEMNKFLLQKVVKNLLENSQDILDQIYEDGQ